MRSRLKRKLDYSDLKVTPTDGKRYELIRGELFVTPSPSPRHQRASRELQAQLMVYFHGRSLGEVFDAPIDLILTRQDVFVPDLVVVADPTSITERAIERAPLLVVEILSPSTRKVDRGLKAQRYAELGVAHYWILDADERRLECHRLEEGVFRLVVEAQGDTSLTHPDCDGLTIDLSALWG